MSSPVKGHAPLKRSVSAPEGFSLSCACGKVFTVAEAGKPVECPECRQKFEAGFAVKATVLSKYSGMPVGVLTGAEAAATPEEAAKKVAARHYDAATLDKVNCRLTASEPAFFDCVLTDDSV